MPDALKNFPVDVDRLLDPISAEQPAGAYLRYEGTYDTVKEQRHADDPSLPQGIYEEELDTADWAAVEGTCMKALETKTKDLQLAGWLTEAWIQRYHFKGAHGGITLMAGLVEGFWEDLYPPVKDGNLEVRLGPIQWVDEKLSLKLKKIPITQPEVSGEANAYTMLDWESTGQGANHGARGAAEEEEEELTRSDVQTSITLTPKAYYRALVDEIEALLDESSRLERLLWERCEEQTVDLTNWKDTLRSIQGVGQRVLAEREPSEETTSEEADEEEAPAWVPEETDDPVEGASIQIQSRSQAYRLLWEAAEYLMRTEPHSPTPYLVKRAVSWGNMSLEELLQELMSDMEDLENIYELLGMDQHPEDADSVS